MQFCLMIVLKFDRVATLSGKPGKVREFESYPEKSGNLKIGQKIKEKSRNFMKLTASNCQLNKFYVNVESKMCII